ncbi:MAG: histidinol-phosphate transaminase [Candidatus Hydrogenedentota bacterium]|nr:MAG: histidinol-phosphate transaminase [Candidatus Hydrogenedentota bacterium]
MKNGEVPESFLRSSLQGLEPYVPGEQGAGNRIKLNTNESPYPPSPRVREAISAAVARLNRYPSPAADEARDAAAEAWRVDRRNVFVGNGSDEVLRLLFQAYVEPGDRVAWSVPTYTLYAVLARQVGARVIEDSRRGDYSVNAEQLAGAGARMVLLCTPNSPTGTVTPRKDIEELCARTEGTRSLVVVDEAYADFSGETAIPLIERFAHLVVVRTLSKSYALAGLRVGFAIADRRRIDELLLLKDSYNVGVLSAAGAAAALRDEEYAREIREKIVAERERLAEGLTEAGWKVYPSGANFVFAEPPDREGGRAYEFLRARGILVRWFGREPRTAAGVRITVGTARETKRLLEVIRDYG